MQMENYIRVIFAIGVTAAVVRAVAPESSLSKYLQMLCSLCAVAVIAFPIYETISDKDSVIELVNNIEFETQNYEEIYNLYLARGELQAAENILSSDLCKAVGAKTDSLRIRLDAERSDGEIMIKGVDVMICSDGVTASPDKIKEYIFERLKMECRIIYLF